MTNPFQQQQPSPQNYITQPKGNRKLWIILGSVIGVLLLSMGGCVACVTLIGLSAFHSDEQNDGTTNAPGGAPRTNTASSSSMPTFPRLSARPNEATGAVLTRARVERKRRPDP